MPRLGRQIREAWPEGQIIVRGDSGFCREELLAWCEANQVDYVLGLAKNERLKAEITAELQQAAEEYQRTGQRQGTRASPFTRALRTPSV